MKVSDIFVKLRYLRIVGQVGRSGTSGKKCDKWEVVGQVGGSGRTNVIYVNANYTRLCMDLLNCTRSF